MDTFLYLLDGMDEFDSVAGHVKNGRGINHIIGVSDSRKSQLIYAISERNAAKSLVIAADETEAGRIMKDLSFLFSDAVLYFPPRDFVFYDVDVSNRKSEYKRLRALSRIGSAKCVVTTAAALLSYTLEKSLYDKYSVSLTQGSEVNLGQLSERLVLMGYTRVSAVEGEGQFSIRGSIIDVYSPSGDAPYRIELWGDEVDSIRVFNPITQLSENNVGDAFICPVRELIYTAQQAQNAAERIRAMKNENLLRDAERFSQSRYFPSNDRYMPMFYEKVPTLLDYFPEKPLVFLDEPKELESRASVFCREQNERITELLEKGLFPKEDGGLFLDYAGLALILDKYTGVSMSTLSRSVPLMKPVQTVSFSSKTLSAYTSGPEYMVDDILFWKKSGFRIVVLLSSETKIHNMSEALLEKGIAASVADGGARVPDFGEVYILKGSLERGFEYPTIKTVVLTDGEETSRRRRRPKSASSRDTIKSFDEIAIGDYVVHRTHGVGQYAGINQLEVQGVVRDYIKLRYKGTDCLYVPVNQLDLLYKYSGPAEEKTVKLNSLGGTQWTKTVSRVKESVSKLAEDMIRLYAARSSAKGHVFPEDTEWQKQFENDFIYDETEDQLRCIDEVKADMEQGKCMDRLLCGDVGYGKTEVALRAAFKCVMEGLQVAYLVPTTILASQHYETFRSRMKDYCVNVEMLSRFRTKKEQKQIAEKLRKGEIDVIIGTHRILQKDISFKSLGMLIVDEEQRFGVGHKERLKEMKQNVDVLTLSATPIPRTLNMAMIGIRDLSVIASPPQDRYPVQTFVMEYNSTVVQNAIEREISRGGQVFYLYNRVENIERIAAQVQSLVPDARVAAAHGKMSETRLEEIMMDLLSGDIDVLVCTTIIETGLDIPNANTIIIENADALGLSQLYQLKGRVGRSNRMSYAYFTYREGKVLDSVAQKRLQAIREFTEFGAGFKIAMRDLEIRGAGNLLGKEQHGNMNLVGYDMYCLLLEQAVKELKGTDSVEKPKTTVDLRLSAFIPEDVIEDESLRIEMYRKIAGIETEDDKSDVISEFTDRYGDVPESVDNLTEMALIKFLASEIFISDITQKDGMVVFTFDRVVSPKSIVDIMDGYKGKMMFSSGETSYLSYKYDENVLSNIKIILQRLKKTIQEEQS